MLSALKKIAAEFGADVENPAVVKVLEEMANDPVLRARLESGKRRALALILAARVRWDGLFFDAFSDVARNSKK